MYVRPCTGDAIELALWRRVSRSPGRRNTVRKKLTGSRIVIRPKSSKARTLLLLIVLLAEATPSEERHDG